MRYSLALILLYLLYLAAPFPVRAQPTNAAAGWQNADQLPNVDFTGLSSAQTKSVLKILREEGCSCGCSMKIAECRVLDPNCSESRALAALVIKSVREGSSPDRIRAAVAASTLAKHPSGPRKVLEDAIKIPVAGAPVKGPKDARITLVEFSDFECPFCSKAVGQIEGVMRAWPRDVKLVFKQLPITSHPHARLAAEASLAAKDQDKFWPMHDKMFANYRRISRENIMLWAKEIGLDMPKFAADLDSGKFRAAIDKDVADSEAANVNATPTLFINGKRYNGLIDVEALKPILAAELK